MYSQCQDYQPPLWLKSKKLYQKNIKEDISLNLIHSKKVNYYHSNEQVPSSTINVLSLIYLYKMIYLSLPEEYAVEILVISFCFLVLMNFFHFYLFLCFLSKRLKVIRIVCSSILLEFFLFLVTSALVYFWNWVWNQFCWLVWSG